MKTWMKCTVFLFLTGLLAMVSQASAANPPVMTVGRVYAVEGDLLRYVPADKDWVAMVNDAPFGVEDTFFSGNQGMAEMLVPNGTWLRVGHSTQVQFIALDPDLSEVDVASGVARFYNKGSETVIKATSPFGYVLAYPGTAFDFYVGENSVEVVAVEGTVSFIHAATNARYDVAADSPSILADAGQVASGDGVVDAGWHRWNVIRDSFWTEKSRLTGRSVEFLPPTLRGESYALEENGRWESIPYEGSSRWFWRPTTVAAGWSPFTAGRWSDWHGDQVWIPSESFGYVTHHYGNWIYVQDSWYWAPPVATRRTGPSLLDIDFYWSPGRVSWIHHDNYVGWVPLGPRETYYSHRRWGGAHDALYTDDIGRISLDIGSYAYAGQAIIVPRDNFYRVDDYRDVRVRTINSTTIINTYSAAPVVNNTVINNYQTDTRRHTFTSRAVEEKPHVSVLRRIEKNAAVIERGKKDDSVTVRRQVRNLKEGHVSRGGAIEAPISTNYIVPASEVDRPASEIKLQQRKIKSGGKPGQSPEQRPVRPERPAQIEKPVARPERMAPAEPTQGTPSRHAIESPRVQPQGKGPTAPSRGGQPGNNAVEQPRQDRQSRQAVEQPRVQPQGRETGKQPKEVEAAHKAVEQPRQDRQPRPAVEQPRVQSQGRETGKQPKEAKSANKAVEQSRQDRQPRPAVEQPRAQPQGRETAKQPKEAKPANKAVVQPRQDRQPQQAVKQPRVQSQQRETGRKPQNVQPAGKAVEQPRQGRQPQQAVEQPRQGKQPAGQQTGKAPGKKPQQKELTEEELEQIRQQKALEQEGNKGQGKSGKH